MENLGSRPEGGHYLRERAHCGAGIKVANNHSPIPPRPPVFLPTLGSTEALPVCIS